MKKRNHLKEIAEIPRQNPVAKYARRFNKAAVFADKRKYCRKAKHAGREVFPIGPWGADWKYLPILIIAVSEPCVLRWNKIVATIISKAALLRPDPACPKTAK